MTQTPDEALRRYRYIQSLEGLTYESELAIARAQGEAWREYLTACALSDTTPESSDWLDRY